MEGEAEIVLESSFHYLVGESSKVDILLTQLDFGCIPILSTD